MCRPLWGAVVPFIKEKVPEIEVFTAPGEGSHTEILSANADSGRLGTFPLPVGLGKILKILTPFGEGTRLNFEASIPNHRTVQWQPQEVFLEFKDLPTKDIFDAVQATYEEQIRTFVGLETWIRAAMENYDSIWEEPVSRVNAYSPMYPACLGEMMLHCLKEVARVELQNRFLHAHSNGDNPSNPFDAVGWLTLMAERGNRCEVLKDIKM